MTVRWIRSTGRPTLPIMTKHGGLHMPVQQLQNDQLLGVSWMH